MLGPSFIGAAYLHKTFKHSNMKTPNKRSFRGPAGSLLLSFGFCSGHIAVDRTVLDFAQWVFSIVLGETKILRCLFGVYLRDDFVLAPLSQKVQGEGNHLLDTRPCHSKKVSMQIVMRISRRETNLRLVLPMIRYAAYVADTRHPTTGAFESATLCILSDNMFSLRAECGCVGRVFLAI